MLLTISCKNWVLVPAAFVAMTLGSASAWAGAESSGGVENYTNEHDTAWFIRSPGNEAIRTCFEVAPGFGQSETALISQIETAFETWSRYARTRVKDFTSDIVMNPEILQKCDGTEDLKIYFGTSDARVEQAKIKYRQPFGLAEAIQTPQSPAWMKGFVWIAPPGSIEAGVPSWADPRNVQGILLHELGHVFGCQHVDGTIMSESISRLLKSAEDRDHAVLAQIDHEKDLYDCRACADFYKNMSAFDSFTYDAFSVLLNKKPGDDERLQSMFIKEASDPRVGHTRPHGTLILQDNSGTYSFKVTTRILLPSNHSKTDLFRHWGGPEGMSQAASSDGSSFYGEIQLLDGSLLPIIYNENIESALWISVLPPSGQKAKHVFAAYRY